jgi:hypothetical protein
MRISSNRLCAFEVKEKSQACNLKKLARNFIRPYIWYLGAELSTGRAYPKTGGLRGDEFRPPGKVRLFTKQLS